MTGPDVSLLVLVRGAGAFLADALASLRAQTHRAWEGLLVGIGTDPAMLHAAAAGDPRLRVFEHDAATEAQALHAAALQARAEVLGVLDGDDLLEADALAALVAVLHEWPDAGMAYGRHVLVDATGRLLGPGPLCELPYTPDALLLDFMTGPLRLLRASAYRAAGGYRAAHADAMDYDLCLRLSETCAIAHLPRATYRRRVHASAPEVARWAEGIQARYAAFVDAVRRRGLDARYDCALEIDSWHIMQPRAGGG